MSCAPSWELRLLGLMREELVSRNVARLVTLPPNRPARQQAWSPKEALAFLQVARGDRLYPAFVLLLA